VATITSRKGTELSVNVKGCQIFLEDGMISQDDVSHGNNGENLPSGEIFLVPGLQGTNGRVIFDLAFHQGEKLEDIEVEFRDGKAVPIAARLGFELFKDVLAHSSGDKDLLAEFGRGLNPEIKKAIGLSILDEKMDGTVHLALGDNTVFGGKTDSDLHWDLLILEPTVILNGDTIIKDGQFKI